MCEFNAHKNYNTKTHTIQITSNLYNQTTWHFFITSTNTSEQNFRFFDIDENMFNLK